MNRRVALRRHGESHGEDGSLQGYSWQLAKRWLRERGKKGKVIDRDFILVMLSSVTKWLVTALERWLREELIDRDFILVMLSSVTKWLVTALECKVGLFIEVVFEVFGQFLFFLQAVPAITMLLVISKSGKKNFFEIPYKCMVKR